MSSQLKREAQQEVEYGKDSSFYSRQEYSENSHRESKVNLNDLVNRLKLEKKKERKSNLILSVAAVSAVTVFGIILTL